MKFKFAIHIFILLVACCGFSAHASTSECEFEAKTPSEMAVNLLLSGLDHTLVDMDQLRELAQTQTASWENPFRKYARSEYGLSFFNGFNRVLRAIRTKSKETQQLLKAKLAEREVGQTQVADARENTKLILGAPRPLTTLDIPSKTPGEYKDVNALSDPAVVNGRPIVVGTFYHPKSDDGLVVFDPLNPNEKKRVQLRTGSWGSFGKQKPLIFEREGKAYVFVPGKDFAYNITEKKIVTFRQLKIPKFSFNPWYKNYLTSNSNGQKFLTINEGDAQLPTNTFVLSIIDLNGETPIKTVDFKCQDGRFHNVKGRTLMTCISPGVHEKHIQVYDVDNAVELPPFKIKGDQGQGIAREHSVLFEENGELQIAVQIRENATKGGLLRLNTETGEWANRLANFQGVGLLKTVTLQGKTYIHQCYSKYDYLVDFQSGAASPGKVRQSNEISGFFDWQTESYYYQMLSKLAGNEFQIYDQRWHMIGSIRMNEATKTTSVFEHEKQLYVILIPESSPPILYRLTNEGGGN